MDKLLPTENNAIYMAFDFGTKKIGVAVGQAVTLSANPIACLSAKKGVPDWNAVLALITKWQPAALVVGIPLNMDATTQSTTFKAKKFASELTCRFHLPVHEVDERLTTVAAKETLFELGGYKALKEISIDSYAAKLILETWMRQHLS